MADANEKKDQLWATMLPGLPEGENSCQYIQRVLYIAMSHIMYRREMLPAQAFQTRFVGSVQAGVLMKRSTGQANMMGICLKGIAEAVRHRYLEAVSMVIMMDGNVEATEVYTFTIHYSESCKKAGESSGTEDNPISVDYYDINSTRKQITRLLKRINWFCDHFECLPAGYNCQFKATYYDEITPADYEPPGFHADTEFYEMSAECPEVQLGRLDCQKHVLLVTARSVNFLRPSEINIGNSSLLDVTKMHMPNSAQTFLPIETVDNTSLTIPVTESTHEERIQKEAKAKENAVKRRWDGETEEEHVGMEKAAKVNLGSNHK